MQICGVKNTLTFSKWITIEKLQLHLLNIIFAMNQGHFNLCDFKFFII